MSKNNFRGAQNKFGLLQPNFVGFIIPMILQNTTNYFKYRAVAAVGFLFSTSSLMLAIWASALPFIKLRMGLTDGELGLLLLLAPAGSITGVLLSAEIFGRIKVGEWLGVGNIIFCVLMCAEVWAPNVYFYGVALYLRGMFGFLNGVAVNTVTANLEKSHGRRFMSTSHALYSVGGAVGAAFAATLFGFGISSKTQIIVMALSITTVILFLKSTLSKNDYFIHSGSGYKLPNKSILGLSFICLVMFMAEGCVVDWSSIYLKRELLSPLYLISIGYGGFSVAMTLGRLNGDLIIPKIGERRIIIFGTFIAAAGYLLTSFATVPWLAIIGFILVGFGSCCIVPVLFSAGAHIPGVSAVQGFGMITSGGLIGFLAGPSIIGFISERYSLALGFVFVAVMLLLATLAGYRNKFLS